jgi:hypothetical protein
MPKRGRPFEYETDEERPVTVSIRIPRDLYDRMEHYRKLHQQSITEIVLDGLKMRLDTPADPRDVILSDDNTVIREVQDMIQAAVQAEIGKLGDFLNSSPFRPTSQPGETVKELPHNDNTVIQDNQAPTRGRPIGTMRQHILTLLSEHPEGLNAEQIRGYLTPEKPIGDTLQGMRRHDVVKTEGKGKDMRYFTAEGTT